jgi:hypothetical protein
VNLTSCFDEWLAKAKAAVETPTTFKPFLTNLTNIRDAILKHHALPSPITVSPEQFGVTLSTTFIIPLLNKSNIEDGDFRIVYDGAWTIIIENLIFRSLSIYLLNLPRLIVGLGMFGPILLNFLHQNTSCFRF